MTTRSIQSCHRPVLGKGRKATAKGFIGAPKHGVCQQLLYTQYVMPEWDVGNVIILRDW